MKTYDYKDETKDVRGKVTSIPMFKDFTIFNLDRKIKRYQWTSVNVRRLEKRGYSHNTKPGWSYVNDREEYI